MQNSTCKPAILLAILFMLFSCGTDRNLKRGEKHLALGEYFDASSEYKTAYSKTPAKERSKRGQIAKKMAYCYDKVESRSES